VSTVFVSREFLGRFVIGVGQSLKRYAAASGVEVVAIYEEKASGDGVIPSRTLMKSKYESYRRLIGA
jgi:hypothetical protein